MLCKSPVALLLTFFMHSTSTLADHALNSIEAEVDTLLPISTSQEMCVDTPPLNDGYGWNGMCTCRLPGSYEQFGNSIVTDGNRVIIGSEESPNSCQGSGTTSVYQIQADGSLEKEAELVSSARESNDAFALWSSDFALSGDYLAVGSRDSNKLTVFSFDGSSWSEHYVKELAERASLFSIHRDELFAVTPGNEISRFNINDGSLIQTISFTASCQSTIQIRSFHVLDDLISINTSCNNNRVTFIFRQTSTGEYVQASSFELDTRFQSLSRMADGKKIILGGGNNGALISRLETGTDTWTLLEPLETLYDAYNLLDGQLFLIRTTSRFVDFIRVYELDTAGTKWVQKQTLNFHSDAFVGRMKRMDFSGNKLSVIRSQQNSEDSRPMDATVSLFEKDNAKQWRLIFEQEFTGPKPYTDGGRFFTSSTFAGNNLLLSVMDNEVKNIRFEPGQTGNDTGDTGSCDYSNADLFNGWGWNATTQSSCPPAEVVVNTNACDYSNAALFNGWGWNNETRESCPPIESDNTNTNIETNDCDYTDAALNGGWGWNAITMQSCSP